MSKEHPQGIPLRDQLPLMRAIVKKDVASCKGFFVITLLLSLIMAFFGLLALHEPSEGTDAEFWEKNLTWMFIMAIVLNSFPFFLTLHQFHEEEITRGSMGSLALYPLDINGITLSKIASTALVSSVIGSMLFLSFSPVITGMRYYMGALIVQAFTLVLYIWLVTTAAFVSNIIAYRFKTHKVSPLLITGIFMLFGVLFSELIFLGLIAPLLLGRFFGVSTTTLESIHPWISFLSPFHHVGQVLHWLLVSTGSSIDLPILVILSVVTIIAGFILGKRIYLDIFFRE